MTKVNALWKQIKVSWYRQYIYALWENVCRFGRNTWYIFKREPKGLIFSLISISSLPIYTWRTTREIWILQNRHKLHDLAIVLLCLFYQFTLCMQTIYFFKIISNPVQNTVLCEKRKGFISWKSMYNIIQFASITYAWVLGNKQIWNIYMFVIHLAIEMSKWWADVYERIL